MLLMFRKEVGDVIKASFGGDGCVHAPTPTPAGLGRFATCGRRGRRRAGNFDPELFEVERRHCRSALLDILRFLFLNYLLTF